MFFIEEGTELDERDFTQLNLRLRQPGVLNQIILAYNPISKGNWIYDSFDVKNNYKDAELCIRSTYKDNQFLPDEYIQELERLMDTDPEYHKVYALGEWGNLAEGLIFPNYEVVDEMPEGAEIIYGLDFGISHPMAMTKLGILENNLFMEEIFYKTGETVTGMIPWMDENVPKSATIYADSARVDLIKDIQDAGWFDCNPSRKGPDTVYQGIETMRQYKLFVISGSSNLSHELDRYRWKPQASGDLTQKPVKFHDDLIDSVRYGIYTHTRTYHTKEINYSPV
jgi:phage terminase large subunit